jgi:serine/threonine-protein kinase
MVRFLTMADGNAASDEDVPEELSPEDVAPAAQTTHRRPKLPGQPAAIDIPMADFEDQLVEIVADGPLSPPPMSTPAQSAPATDPYLGKVIAERYMVERLLGVGSMGLVYRCRHTVLDKTVALKIIRQDLAQDAETVGRFMTEARSASAIGSKHIVEVLDFGTLPDGASYIVMEYLEGLTLGEALDAPGGLSIGDALDIAIQMSEALGAAHLAGVVHRDLKPDNVFLLQSERGWFVKILDFGIAKIMQGGQKLTVAGSVIGTPHYMSPEQATGARTDARTDVYSLGVIMYEMACGKVPFDAENPLAVISMQVTDEPPPLRKRMPAGRTLPTGLEAVIHKCLVKDTTDRFSTMEDVRAALERIAGGGVPLVAPPSSQKEAGTDSYTEELNQDTDFRELHAHGRRRRWIARGALLMLMGGTAAGAYFVARPRIAAWVEAERAAAASFQGAMAATSTANTTNGVGTPGAATVTPGANAPGGAVTASATGVAVAASAPMPAAPGVAPDGSVIHVALILFPLNSHVFDGDKDLGMMPITIDVKPDETKVVNVVRKGYVTRPLKIDGSKTRIVVGLVSDAAAAKRHGKSLDEAVAEADRAAESLAADDADTEPATGSKGARVAARGDAHAATADAAAAPDKADGAPAEKPKPHGGKTTLAPNPFGD